MSHHKLSTVVLAVIVAWAVPHLVLAETLEQAWVEALVEDHGLQAVRENTLASEHQLQAAKAARLPNVSISSAYSVLEEEPLIKAAIGGNAVTIATSEKETLSYQAITSIPLYTSGQISGKIDAATAGLQASQFFEAGKVLDLKLTVAEAFVAVLRSNKALDVVNSHVASLRGHVADVVNLHEQGMVSRNDLLAAQVALADAVQLSIKVANGADIATAAYNRLLGRPLQQSISLDELKPVSASESLAELTTRALDGRYELQVLQQQSKALKYQAGAIRAQSGPQLALSGGYVYRENNYQLPEGQWMVNLGMQWKVFDAGLTHHQAQASERQARALQRQYDDVSSQVSLQVRQYWLATQETAKRIKVSEKSINQAEENLRVNRDRYEHGLSTNTEVLAAEALRVRSLDNHANAIYDSVLAGLRLKRAVSEL